MNEELSPTRPTPPKRKSFPTESHGKRTEPKRNVLSENQAGESSDRSRKRETLPGRRYFCYLTRMKDGELEQRTPITIPVRISVLKISPKGGPRLKKTSLTPMGHSYFRIVDIGDISPLENNAIMGFPGLHKNIVPTCRQTHGLSRQNAQTSYFLELAPDLHHFPHGHKCKREQGSSC